MMGMEELMPQVKSQEEVKEEMVQFINKKYEELYERSKEMIKNFHIDIIRQFEIQKVNIIIV